PWAGDACAAHPVSLARDRGFDGAQSGRQGLCLDGRSPRSGGASAALPAASKRGGAESWTLSSALAVASPDTEGEPDRSNPRPPGTVAELRGKPAGQQHVSGYGIAAGR